MPELPEVETIVNGLRGPLIGRTFTGVRVGWENIVARPPVPEFQRRITGQRIVGIRRRGKYLIFDLSEGDRLLIHLKMTGQLTIRPGHAPPDKYGHTVFDLDDGRQLRFLDMRKFGRVYLVADEKEVVGGLGPEPLANDFTLSEFLALIGRRKGALKPLLLNQQFMAGIGNIYADEALFVAGIHPRRSFPPWPSWAGSTWRSSANRNAASPLSKRGRRSVKPYVEPGAKQIDNLPRP